jgi:hypothetical protein
VTFKDEFVTMVKESVISSQPLLWLEDERTID